jgi:hypothetical protein
MIAAVSRDSLARCGKAAQDKLSDCLGLNEKRGGDGFASAIYARGEC